MSVLTIDDLKGWILGRMSGEGVSEDNMVRMAITGVKRYFDAADRWERLETPQPVTAAPLWLSTQEQQKLLDALRGHKGAEVRMLRQAIADLIREGA